MAQCPSCATSVDIDFGMATCPACSLVFMVGIDGTSSMPDADEPVGDDRSSVAYSEEHAPADMTNMYNDPLQSSDLSSSYDVENSEPLDDSTMMVSSVDSLEDITDDATQMYNGVEETLIESPAEEEAEYNDHFLSDMDSAAPPVEDPDATQITDASDPLGVQKFDKTRASQLVDGPYYYDLTLDGLDTGEIKDKVMEALSDQRFQWTSEDIKKNFRSGKLVFKNLNPAKAVLLVIKLQHIDVEISWVQKMHTDPSVGSGTVG